jgi:hypothetical protein
MSRGTYAGRVHQFAVPEFFFQKGAPYIKFFMYDHISEHAFILYLLKITGTIIEKRCVLVKNPWHE